MSASATHHHELIETLREAQRLGFFGPGDIVAAVRHAESFVAAIGDAREHARVVDLGSGGGLPGLVVAGALPGCRVLLIDRRQKRTDFLTRAVGRLGWGNVEVRCGEVADLVDEVRTGVVELFDVVTARGFGPPVVTLRFAAGLIADHGRIVISEPPAGDRWPADVVAEAGLTSERQGAVRVFARRGSPAGPPSADAP